jgi:predicted nucleic acid-binding protein
MRIFLDASCWIAAAGNAEGGSSEILRLAALRGDAIIATPLVLAEAERNITGKLGREAFSRYLRIIAETPIEVIPIPSLQRSSAWDHIVPDKDTHVLAGAIEGRADLLVSLDRRHILTDSVRAQFPVPVMDTREALRLLRRLADR